MPKQSNSTFNHGPNWSKYALLGLVVALAAALTILLVDRVAGYSQQDAQVVQEWNLGYSCQDATDCLQPAVRTTE